MNFPLSPLPKRGNKNIGQSPLPNKDKSSESPLPKRESKSREKNVSFILARASNKVDKDKKVMEKEELVSFILFKSWDYPNYILNFIFLIL